MVKYLVLGFIVIVVIFLLFHPWGSAGSAQGSKAANQQTDQLQQQLKADQQNAIWLIKNG